MSKNTSDRSPILLFDGVCNLCNQSVQFSIRRDREGIIKYASLQSEKGQSLLQQFDLDTDVLKSVVFIDRNKAYTKSDAALRLVRYFDNPWKWATVFSIVPKFIRDAVYDWIARNRYRWFGKEESCWLPTPELKKRFLG